MDFNKPSLPEITVKAVIMGAVLSVILGAANMYFGLFAGMTISATIPAAVVSMGLLRLFKKYNILENNFIKTAASAGESLAAGVIFTIPALVIMGFWDRFYYWPITVIALFGGILGVLFTIPLRRLLIVEERLKFPEGVAAAEVLKSGYRGGSDIGYIVRSAMAGALFKLGATGLKVWAEILEGAKAVGGTVAYFGSNLSPALLSVGYIVGINIAILMFIGGALNWLVAIPICSLFTKWGVYPEGHNLAGQAMSALDWANKLWGSQTRYIGVGAMLVGGLWTIFKLRKSLLKGVMDGIRAYRKIGVAGSGGLTAERVERDIPMKWVLLGIVASIVPIFLLYEHFVDKVSVSLPMALIMVLTGFLFSAVAGYMAGLVGSSNNPVSGVTIATVLVSALILLFMLGSGAKNGPAAAIIIGGVVCCAAAIAGDVMQDLKTGHILKNTPWKLQVAEIIGTISAAFIMAPVLMLLYKAYGFKGHISGLDISGLPKKDALAAPQANLMESVAKQVFSGDVPWNFVLIGVGVAAAVIILDEYFIRRGSSFRTPVLAVAIGIYLPLELETPILAGGIISYLIQSYRRRKNTAIEFVQEGDKRGLLLASGLITGEALMGILIAVPIVILQKSEPLALMEKPIGAWPGIILLVFVAAWLYKSALGTKQQADK
jgi:putative OPT family oligopeptide transporter